MTTLNTNYKPTANSIQQYNKWKSWLDGGKHEADYFILATTYLNDFYKVFGYEAVKNKSNSELFTLFAKMIQKPKQ